MLRKVVLIMEGQEMLLSQAVVPGKVFLWDVSVIIYERVQYVCMQICMHV